jgi:chromosome segregation ATPase
MLDTDQPNPPETIQPFLGHAREEYDRRQAQAATPAPVAAAPVAPPRNDRALEAERIKAEVSAERDRLVKEAGLYKAILSKLVTNPAGDTDASIDPTMHEALATLGVSMAPGLPGAAKAQNEVALWRANEEKSRLEGKVKQHQAELDIAKAQIQKHQAELEAANAEVRKHQALVDERQTLFERANQEREFAEQKLHALKAELDQARTEAEEHRNRLATEVPSALKTADEASQKLKEIEARLNEVTLAHEEAVRKEAALIAEHTKALEEAERQRTALSITVDRLTQAVVSARAGEYEALDRLEDYASSLVEADAALQAELAAERKRSNELDQIVKELQTDIETIRLENLANAKVRDAEMNEHRRRFADERKTLTAEIDKSRAATAEAERRFEELNARMQEKLVASGALAEEWRTAVDEAQTQHQAEIARLEASLAKREQIRSSLADENRRLLEANGKLVAENNRLLAQVAEAGHSGDSSDAPPSKKLAQAIEQNQMLHLDNVRLGNLVETAKIEADRRQKSLVLEVQRIKAEYEKLVAANEKLVDRVQEVLAEKMALIESQQSSNGVRSAAPVPAQPAAPVPSALDLDQAVALANRSKEVELHRDIAFSMLYGDTMVEKRSSNNGH